MIENRLRLELCDSRVMPPDYDPMQFCRELGMDDIGERCGREDCDHEYSAVHKCDWCKRSLCPMHLSFVMLSTEEYYYVCLSISGTDCKKKTTTTEIATRTWTEKLDSGEVVSVVEVLDDFTNECTEYNFQHWDHTMLEVIESMIESKGRAIYILERVWLAAYDVLYRTGSVAVPRREVHYDSVVVASMQEALETMSQGEERAYDQG